MSDPTQTCTSLPQHRRELAPLVVNRREMLEKGIFLLNGARIRLQAAPRKGLLFSIGRHIPDLLTFSRCILGAFLIWAGLSDGQASLSRDIWLLVMSWSTDMIDGRLSRSLRTANRSWLGRNDVYVDMFVSAAVLVYLAGTGLLPLWILALYLVVWSVLFIKWGIPALFAQVFQNPIYAYFVFLTVQSAPWVLPWLLLWALVALVIFWRRAVDLGKNLLRAVANRTPGG